MAVQADNKRCMLGCWAMGAIAAVLTAILLRMMTEMTWPGSIFCGIIVFLVLGFFLPLILCRPLPTAQEAQAQFDQNSSAARDRVSGGAAAVGAVGAATAATAAAAMSTGTSDASAAAAKADADAAAAKARADADAKAKADAAAKARSDADAKTRADAAAKARSDADAKARADAAAKARSDADAKTRADAAAKAKSDAASKTMAADAKTASDAELDAKLGVDYDGDGVREGANEGTRPAALTGPRGGKADDLKMIKGVGPKMEKMCNGLGFYHFDQIASWSRAEVAWVDANLEGFKGRVTRDTWVEQAKLLAAGGETAFSKKVGKGDVY